MSGLHAVYLGLLVVIVGISLNYLRLRALAAQARGLHGTIAGYSQTAGGRIHAVLWRRQ